MLKHIAVLLLVSLALTVPAVAAEFEVESLDQVVEMHGIWRFRVGDDLAWADPDYDHVLWDNILVPRDWRRQGHGDLSGMAWYRAKIQFDLSQPGLRGSLHGLGIALGKIHSAYELYAGGRLIGGAGRLPPAPLLSADRKRIFSLPASAVNADGELLLAVRVWRDDALGRASTSGMYEGRFLVGTVFDLTKAVWFPEAITLMLAIGYMVFGLFSLYLYLSNRKLTEFLWFSVTTLMVALYSLELSQWKYVVGYSAELPFLLHKKLEYTLVYLLPIPGLQLVFSLLSFTPPLWVRFYQAGFAVFGLLVLLWPNTDILAHTLFNFQLYLMPGLAAVLLFVVWCAARGNREARTMSLGWAFFLFAAVNDILLSHGLVQHPRLLTIGFAAIILSMALSLGNRFTRMYSHLDGAVRERTRELEQSNEKLSEVARMDALTGLLNRRGFAERADTEILRASRSQRGFVVMMGDIDHFKAFNDQYGHACGDFVLRETAILLSQQLRDVDTMARWGGEEFIFLLPETSLEGGTTLAEKLRSVLESAHFNFGGNELGLTITIGVAEFAQGMSLDDCLVRADAALYQGKQSGRNRVVVDQAAAESTDSA
ncbi:MAG: diguanylate cyclase [Halieaceae bacterium]